MTNHLKLILSLPIVFLGGYSILYVLNIVTVFPSNENLAHWDVGWYQSIIEHGYQFDKDKQSNIAFFPLFPYLWKISNLSAIGISIFNYCLFLCTTLIISNTYKLTKVQTLLIATTPSLLFTFIPYSESLFFFFTTLILIGLYRKKYFLCFIGIFLASLERSSALFFLAPLIYLIFNNTWRSHSIKPRYFLLILTGFLSVLIVAYIQWTQVGQWFVFYQAQDAWNHHIQVPSFPLTTWRGKYNLPLDTTHSYFGLIALILLCYHFLQTITKRNFIFKPGDDWLFSIVFIAEMFVFILLFQGGSMFSLNRYIGGTSFFIVFGIHFLQKYELKKTHLIIVSTLLASLVSFYNHEEPLIFGLLLIGISAYILLWIFSFTKRKKWYSYTLIVLNVIIQYHYFHMYLTGEWVG